MIQTLNCKGIITMKNHSTRNQLAAAVKRATLCAATASLLTAAPMAQAET
jgi:hypothetical protein